MKEKIKVNTKLLRKVQKQVLEVPNRLIMSDIALLRVSGTFVLDYGLQFSAPRCGTVACIAGWTVLLHDGATEGPDIMVSLSRASELLFGTDLNNQDIGGQLFFVDNWPKRYRKRWGAAKTTRTRARIVGQLIDQLIASRGDFSDFKAEQDL